MPVTPNALNDGHAVLPEAQAVYMDPASWKYWGETGAFRDGIESTLSLLEPQWGDRIRVVRDRPEPVWQSSN